MNIVDMSLLTDLQLRQAAQILTDAIPIGWETFNEARDEIQERLIPENTLLAAVENGEVIGWGGILPHYDGNVWELHPLAVRENCRRKGVGSALLGMLELKARQRGGRTLCIWADDERPEGETSFANVNLYDDFPAKISSFEAGTHQAAFYIKHGYRIMGVMPDADGAGKPDILLCKPL